MGSTVIVMGILKLGAALGTGVAVASAMSFFHNYEWKPKVSKKETKETKKGENDGASNPGKSLRKASGSID